MCRRDQPRRIGREHQIHAAGEGQSGLAVAQALAGQVDRHQRGSARRVDRKARSLEAERVGQSPRRKAMTIAREGIGILAAGARRLAQVGIIGGRHAHEHASGTPHEASRILTCPLQGLPPYLEQETLLGIEVLGLSRRYPEEARVEATHRLAQEAAPAGRSSLRVRGGVLRGLDPPAVRGDLRHRVAPLLQELEERFWRVCAARKTTGHSDDGDWRRFLAFGCGQLGLHLVERHDRLVQRGQARWRARVRNRAPGRRRRARAPVRRRRRQDRSPRRRRRDRGRAGKGLRRPVRGRRRRREVGRRWQDRRAAAPPTHEQVRGPRRKWAHG